MVKVAILIPCYNEEQTEASVVKDVKSCLPEADIYVYDNNSKDKTAEIAAKSGAIVRTETRQGKGNVVRRMFADVEADVYVMVDGDATYDMKAVPNMIKVLLEEKLDMVVGIRSETDEKSYRNGHRNGNKLLTKLVEVF